MDSYGGMTVCGDIYILLCTRGGHDSSDYLVLLLLFRYLFIHLFGYLNLFNCLLLIFLLFIYFIYLFTLLVWLIIYLYMLILIVSPVHFEYSFTFRLLTNFVLESLTRLIQFYTIILC